MPPKETHPDTGPGVLEESLSGSNLESDLEEEESEGESQGGPAPSGTKVSHVSPSGGRLAVMTLCTEFTMAGINPAHREDR